MKSGREPTVKQLTMKSGRELKWTWKKPKGKPKRNRHAYNIFMADKRHQIREDLANAAADRKLWKSTQGGVENKSKGSIRFVDEVARRWKDLGLKDKEYYTEKARQDTERYRIELAEWQRTQDNAVLLEAVFPDDISPLPVEPLTAPAWPSLLSTYDPHISNSDASLGESNHAPSTSASDEEDVRLVTPCTNYHSRDVLCPHPPGYMYDSPASTPYFARPDQQYYELPDQHYEPEWVMSYVPYWQPREPPRYPPAYSQRQAHPATLYRSTNVPYHGSFPSLSHFESTNLYYSPNDGNQLQQGRVCDVYSPQPVSMHPDRLHNLFRFTPDLLLDNNTTIEDTWTKST